MSKIGAGDDPNAQVAIDSLIANFNGHPMLPGAISGIFSCYYINMLADEGHFGGDYLIPVTVWEEVLERFPDFFYFCKDSDLYYFIADCYRHVDDFEKAIQYYDIVAANWTRNQYAVLSHVSVPRINIVTDDYDAVHALIDSLLADFGEHPGLAGAILRTGQEYYGQAHWYANQGLDAEAQDYYFKAIVLWERIITELPPSAFSATTCHFLAVSYRELGECQKVIDYATKLVDTWPAYEYAWHAQSLMEDCDQRLSSSGK